MSLLLLDSLKNLLAESDLVLLRCCRPTVALDAHSLHAMASPAPAPAAQPPDPQRLANKIRFETELEFVSCLANPFYLQSLAQQGLFDSEPFLNYLTYLLYFRQPTYSRFLQYPQSLHHLTLLTSSASFRKALKEQPLLAQEWAGKMVAHWAVWREREGLGLGEAMGGLASEGGKKEDGGGAGACAAAGDAAELNGGEETKQVVAATPHHRHVLRPYDVTRRAERSQTHGHHPRAGRPAIDRITPLERHRSHPLPPPLHSLLRSPRSSTSLSPAPSSPHMSHPLPPFRSSSGPTLTALTLSPATSPTDGPGFDTLTNEGVGVFVPLWAIRRALGEREEGGMGRAEGEGEGGAEPAPVPSQRSQPAPALAPALFPSLPLLSSSSSSTRSSSAPTPFEAGAGGVGGAGGRVRASFAFPSATSAAGPTTTTTTTLPPAYFPPPPPPHAPHTPLSFPRPLPPNATFPTEASTSNSDSDSDISNHASTDPYAALAGPALEKARADFLAHDWAYRASGGSSADGNGEEGREKGRESDAEWVPEREEGGGGGNARGNKGRKRSGAEAGGGVVTEPATEPLTIRWTPSLRAFLPSTSPYRSLSPTQRSTLLTFPPSSYVRVFTSPSSSRSNQNESENEVFPYSSSSAKRNTFLRALLTHRFPSLSCACGFSFLRPSTSGEGGERGGWKKPSVLRDHLARCVVLGEEDEVRRMCALERGVAVEEKMGREKEKGRADESRNVRHLQRLVALLAIADEHEGPSPPHDLVPRSQAPEGARARGVGSRAGYVERRRGGEVGSAHAPGVV
ncbi:Mediator of RNA polymerase II transcription subunit 31 [Rhodotorula toruloides]|nr:Mediator of RNA polymerase II transcription subunit 31 [Rhodotorula toruloides]